MRYLGLAVLGLAVAAPAAASDDNGYAAIAAGDFVRAARQLEPAHRLFPDHPELTLNLAVAYTRMGRVAAARALYADVLARPEVLMDVSTGETLSSHAIATLAMARMGQMVATR